MCSPKLTETNSSPTSPRHQALVEQGESIWNLPENNLSPSQSTQIARDPRAFAQAVADLPTFLWPSPGAPNGRAIVLGEQSLLGLGLEERDTALRILLSARIAAELSYHPQAKQRRDELSATVGRLKD